MNTSRMIVIMGRGTMVDGNDIFFRFMIFIIFNQY